MIKIPYIGYRARLAELSEELNGACASCTLWLLILLPLLPGEWALEELTGGASWFCFGLGASDALFPRAPSTWSLLGESLAVERIFSGFGGGGLSRSKKNMGNICNQVANWKQMKAEFCNCINIYDSCRFLINSIQTQIECTSVRTFSGVFNTRGRLICMYSLCSDWLCWLVYFWFCGDQLRSLLASDFKPLTEKCLICLHSFQ